MEAIKQSRSIKKFTFKGKDIDSLLKLNEEQLKGLLPAR